MRTKDDRSLVIDDHQPVSSVAPGSFIAPESCVLPASPGGDVFAAIAPARSRPAASSCMVDGGRAAAAAASASRLPSARPADSSARRFGSHLCRSPPAELSASMPASVASPVWARIRSDTRSMSDKDADALAAVLFAVSRLFSRAASRSAIASRRIAKSGDTSPSS